MKSFEFLSEAVSSSNIYTVKSGDSLQSITQTFDTTPDGIMWQNPQFASANDIIIGSRLRVPGGSTGSEVEIPANTGWKFKSGAVDPNEIKSYLKSKGLDNNQAAGLLANIRFESKFRPGMYTSSDGGEGQSGGLFAFHDGVSGRGAFTNMVNEVGKQWQTDWQKQIDFALGKNLGRQYIATKFNTPGDAAAWWLNKYEAPTDTSGNTARIKAADQYV